MEEQECTFDGFSTAVYTIDEKNLKLLLFGGKGGVGKTTCAAATAVHIAREYPGKKVLIFSTDPAHSLSDSFDYKIGDEITQMTGLDNLYALEINIDDTFEEFKKRYRKKVNAGFDSRSYGAEQNNGTKRRIRYNSH